MRECVGKVDRLSGNRHTRHKDRSKFDPFFSGVERRVVALRRECLVWKTRRRPLGGVWGGSTNHNSDFAVKPSNRQHLCLSGSPAPPAIETCLGWIEIGRENFEIVRASLVRSQTSLRGRAPSFSPQGRNIGFCPGTNSARPRAPAESNTPDATFCGH